MLSCLAAYLCSVDDDDLSVWQQHRIIHVAAVRHGLLLPAAAAAAAAEAAPDAAEALAVRQCFTQLYKK
jgi:hypothetical protein